ncbi:LysR family transcriptional regulator [Vibrio sp. ES.051]|uniref:transcriptional regulator CynR n=1 Tax=Vibrio sp. ES.051 TaxID=1761909 RepID=UPI000BF975ED|nr:transcriptional regulator CynR [Vibrio sp. ES.051]PFG55263.1 LysR family transcriptional regulator [Vibrio sp. ES.051]
MILRHIKYFLAVAEHGSFTQASASMYVSQPALSQQIKQLEENLGVVLFDRSGRKIRLTDAGEVYARYARRSLQDLEEGLRAIHDVADLSRGNLRIAITPTFSTYFIGPLIKAFHKRYPHITLSVDEVSQEKMEEKLLEDVGIAFETVQSSGIDSQPLLVETLALVAALDNPLAKKNTINLKSLNDQSLVLLNRDFATRVHLDQYFREHQLHPQVQMEANSLSAVIEIVRHTQLSTLLPASIAENYQELKAIPIAPSFLQRTVVLLQRKGVYQTAATQALIQLAHQQIKMDASLSNSLYHT